MNILLTDATDIFAGGEEYVLTLGRHLALRGHRVWVSARPGHLLLRKCEEASLPAVPLGYGPMGALFAVAHRLRRALHEREIAIVHSNANYDRTCAALASSFSPARHVAGVHSAHSIRRNITHLLRNRYGTAHFITDAEAGREILIGRDRILPRRVTTVPIGIDAEAAEARARSRLRTRMALGIDEERVVIGNVARLVPFKGHRFLLEAAALVSHEAADCLFLIAGDGELEAELKARAAALGLESSVLFLGFRDDLGELYPAFDIYCHSSIDLASEMFPIAILRALASALPVVATDVGGVGAMIEEGVSGYLLPPGDPDAFSRALLRVVRDRQARRALGQASYELFERKYRAAAMAENVERIYHYVLEEA